MPSQTKIPPPTPEPLTEARLAAIEARADAATPGPWTVYGRGGMGYDVDEPSGWLAGMRGAFEREADAAFVAAARADVPDLVAEVRRLRTVLAPYADGDCELQAREEREDPYGYDAGSCDERGLPPDEWCLSCCARVALATDPPA